MSKTTIVEHLKGENPFGPDHLTAEIGYLSCGFRDDSWLGNGAWCASSFTAGYALTNYSEVRYEMDMLMDGLQIAFPTHKAMLTYFREHAHEERKHHAYPTYQMWLAGKYANYRIVLNENQHRPLCLNIVALKSIA